MNRNVQAIKISLVAAAVFLIAGIAYFLMLRSMPLLELRFASAGRNVPRRLDTYTFERLAKQSFVASPIEIGALFYERPEFSAYLCSFRTALGQKVSGVVNIPKGDGPFPVIVMLRGYVDKEQYRPGLGTRGAADGFARHGFLTIAPDFLGYGSSDPESTDVFETRFEKPLTVLSLLASLSSLPQADTTKIGLWGHSNGGQIAFSVLEITKLPYPTALWAPVSLGFPESVTNFYDELADKGVYLKNQLENEFLWRYKPQDYSITDHWDHIQGEIQIHQGGKDTLVTPSKTEQTVETLKSAGVKVKYYFYPNENHLFSAGSAPEAVAKDAAFFQARWQK